MNTNIDEAMQALDDFVPADCWVEEDETPGKSSAQELARAHVRLLDKPGHLIAIYNVKERHMKLANKKDFVEALKAEEASKAKALAVDNALKDHVLAVDNALKNDALAVEFARLKVELAAKDDLLAKSEQLRSEQADNLALLTKELNGLKLGADEMEEDNQDQVDQEVDETHHGRVNENNPSIRRQRTRKRKMRTIDEKAGESSKRPLITKKDLE